MFDDIYDEKKIIDNVSSINGVAVYDVIDSTNTEAKRLFLNGLKRPTLLLASHQTAGRGRQDKSFFSPRGTGIYLTILSPSINPIKNIISEDLLTLQIAVAACEAIKKLTSKIVGIKWVNDLFLANKKIGGILTEKTICPSDNSYAHIIGLGINITTKYFPNDISQIAGSINIDVCKMDLVISIIKHFENMNNDISSLIYEYKKHSIVLGKEIVFNKNNTEYAGRAIDINEHGNLIVELPSGETIILKSGEISLGSENYTK